MKARWFAAMAIAFWAFWPRPWNSMWLPTAAILIRAVSDILSPRCSGPCRKRASGTRGRSWCTLRRDLSAGETAAVCGRGFRNGRRTAPLAGIRERNSGAKRRRPIGRVPRQRETAGAFCDPERFGVSPAPPGVGPRRHFDPRKRGLPPRACRLERVVPRAAVAVNGYNRRLTVAECQVDHVGSKSIVFEGDQNGFPADCGVNNCLLSPGVEISGSARITLQHCTIYDWCRCVDYHGWRGCGIDIADDSRGGHVIDSCDVFDLANEPPGRGAFHSGGHRTAASPPAATEPHVAERSEAAASEGFEPITLRNSRWRCDRSYDIALDQGSSNFRITNNLLLHGGLKLGPGYQRSVENNVLPSVTFDGWPAGNGDVFAHNIITGGYTAREMPAAWGKTVDGNCFAQAWACAGPALDIEAGSLAGDPHFVSPARRLRSARAFTGAEGGLSQLSHGPVRGDQPEAQGADPGAGRSHDRAPHL